MMNHQTQNKVDYQHHHNAEVMASIWKKRISKLINLFREKKTHAQRALTLTANGGKGARSLASEVMGCL